MHLLHNETVDISNIKRNFNNLYRQQGARLNDSDQNSEFLFGEKNNYHQIDNGSSK